MITPKYVLGLINKIFKNAQNDALIAKIKIISYFLSLLAYFLDHTAMAQAQVSSSIIYTVMSHIKNNLDRTVKVKELSELASWAPTHLICVFKKHTGYTYLQFSLWTKMNYAVGLIENTVTPISEILEKTGFYNATHFSKMFKKYCGISSTEYRKNALIKNKNQQGLYPIILKTNFS